ncbi:hypothetical protein D4764_01G0016830 [Takifugu flavidus]|uniref:Reverse transcriptase domain-containing protein n=1 Tax=Takifugu flavidus TaxID=433684 RepID=A0A5C6PSW7_9TELE|nr:hypothetical protein D4764_01G0016830 [Takifugu flavidus]
MDFDESSGVSGRAFTAGDPAELRSVQKELKRSLKESKDAYRKKLESRLDRNQTRDVWSGMRTITGFQKKGIRSADGNVDQANELNQFFNRFDSSSPSPSCPNIPLDNNGSPSHLPEPLTPLPTSSPSPLLTPYMDPSMSPIPPTGLSFTSGQVRRELERLNQRKAAGPDGISPRVLRNCSRQLCGILQHLFNQSLHLQRIPVLWKTSCLVPVPKKTHPVAPSDYRPIALTSHIMKVMERLVLSHLRPLVSPFQDPLQFAYQPKVGVDDAVIYLLQRAYSSLDRPNTTVRVMFFDFSSAFNTIQPRLLRAKLEKMQMDAPLVSWIEDYLTGRPQFVRLRSCVSDPLMSNTGAPQGTVLSPFLFTTYTADFQYHSETCHLQKYSDDTVIVGCVENGQEDEYRDLVESFVRWSRENLLQLNVTKTKEMVVDFRKSKSPPSPVCISGKDVEIVPSYRFLGVQLDNKLEWSTNTDAVYKKAMSRLYFLRRLRSFSVCSRMLQMFYQSVMASTIFFAAVCWGAGIKAKDANRLNKLIKKAGSVVGCRLDNLDEVVRDRMVLKLRTIMDSPSHPLHNTVDKLRSSFSNRLLQPRCSKERRPGDSPPCEPADKGETPQLKLGLSFTSGQVRRELERLNQRKAAGPDGISPRVLRNCSRQLCGILQHLFNQSLHLQRIPVLWKTSCLVPVPKKTHPVAPSDYRPIALTSHIMKVMERLVLSHLRPLVSPFQDPLQFAYQPKVGVDDAVIYLLQRAYSSLDRLNTTVRVMFFDFSSAFNTIQPRLLRAKLEKMQMDAPLVSWIEDYLTGRPQFVRLQSCVSDPLMSNTGAPQGTVLSPFLFTTYTADFQYHSETCHLQKYSDDTVIVGCVENGQEDEYRDLVESFVRWSRENLLQLNVTKTKEMVVDFRKSKSPPSPVCISGKEVELVPSYRFLGVQLDNKLEWSTNTDAVYKKAMSRLYFLRRLRSFSVCSRMLHMFYQSVMASTIFFAAVCWGAGIKAKDANRLNKLIKKAGSVVGCRLDNLDEVVRDRMVLKLRTIMDSPSHPLHNTVDKLRSSFSNRLLQPRCSKERYRKSFLPSAIKLYNSLKPTQQ